MRQSGKGPALRSGWTFVRNANEKRPPEALSDRVWFCRSAASRCNGIRRGKRCSTPKLSRWTMWAGRAVLRHPRWRSTRSAESLFLREKERFVCGSSGLRRQMRPPRDRLRKDERKSGHMRDAGKLHTCVRKTRRCLQHPTEPSWPHKIAILHHETNCTGRQCLR
jgi:hypothetical protein